MAVVSGLQSVDVGLDDVLVVNFVVVLVVGFVENWVVVDLVEVVDSCVVVDGGPLLNLKRKVRDIEDC